MTTAKKHEYITKIVILNANNNIGKTLHDLIESILFRYDEKEQSYISKDNKKAIDALYEFVRAIISDDAVKNLRKEDYESQKCN